jgi:hypothetical protein
MVNNNEFGSLNLQLNINPNNESVRSIDNQFYLDRNFLFTPEFNSSQTQKVRLFITDDEINRLQEVDTNIKSFQNLGVFRYCGPYSDLSLKNNDYSTKNNFQFITADKIIKVPTYDGHYLEFESKIGYEFYITSKSFATNAIGLRLNPDETAPHQPIEVRWLTPILDNNEGKLRNSRLAYLDPSNKMLFVDGLNGNSSRILIANLKGQVILNESFNGYRFETSLAGMANGLYTLRVEQESGAETFRILID